jgi:cytosine deaminase
VVEVVRELGTVARGEEPFIWLVHVISASTYDDARFDALVSNLGELNIGVITCPSAAISMRQYRKFNSPTFNSIARVLELLAGGVQVRLGSDNICDITSPMGTTDVMDELFVLGNAIRYYDLDIMAKLGAGVRLDSADREKIRVHLEEDARLADAVVNLHQGRD